jgi:hypothetical protein
MPFEHRPNTGSIFHNHKSKDTHPDLKGEALIDGVLYEVAAWERQTKNGSTMLSLTFKIPPPKQEAPRRQYKAPPNDLRNPPSDDDLPW